MRFGRLARAFLTIPLLVSAAQAAKVLVVLNPWLNTPHENVVPQIWGTVGGWEKAATPLTQFVPLGNDWFAFTFANATPGGFTLLNRPTLNGVELGWHQYGAGGYDSAYKIKGGDINIDALLSITDTVWIVPNPRAGGEPKFLIQHPKEVVLEFWNPWEGDFPNQAPSVNVGGYNWEPMEPSPSGPGWYQFRAIGFSSLDLTFRSANGASFLGTMGRTATLPQSVRFDSVAANRTIWIHQASAPLGPPVAKVAKPRGYVVDVFNPWDGQFPFQMPRFQFADGYLAIAQPLYDRCGWFRITRYDIAPASVAFQNGQGVGFGVAGLGSKIGFDLASIWLAGSDTARIYPDSTGIWGARIPGSSKTGQCFLTRLAATIRDFSESHPAFEESDCGVVKNMVQDTLDNQRKPIAFPGAEKCQNGTLKEWFRDVPGTNYSACRDIPLELNPGDGLYTYHNNSYFPIDDIDSTLDTFNVKYKADDGKMHNFYFCLESHAVFEYRKGQKFDFIGDDDVWVYINGKLAVDLGGVHVAETASVDLSTLGLTEGHTYPFDFFFCERRQTASDMLITTSMNLRNPPEFELRETPISLGKRQYDLLYHQKFGQGCDALKQEKPTAGLFFITGPQFPGGLQLPTGVQLGGLTIRADSAQLVYDSLSMNRLKPGIYKLRVKMAMDTTQYRDVVFEIPFRPEPKFVVHAPWGGKVGSSMPLEIKGMVGPDPATFAVPYMLDPVFGLRFCLDSACTAVFTDRQMLSTGALGEVSRIWVRGDSIGVYSLKLRNVHGDSSDFRTRIVFQDKGLRWIDSLGREVQPHEILRDPSRTARLWIESYQGSKRCDTCSDVVLLGVDNPSVRFLNPVTNTPITATQLSKGIGSVLLVSDVQALGVSVTASVVDSSFAIQWSPISWRAWHIEYVDKNGNPISNLTGLAADVTNKLDVWARIVGVGGPCTTCNFPGNVFSDSNIVVLDSTGTPTSRVKFVNGLAKLDLLAVKPGAGVLKTWIANSDTATTPVQITPYKLVFLDAFGNAPTPAFLGGEILQPRTGILMVMGRDGLCTKCTGPIQVAGTTGLGFVSVTGESVVTLQATSGVANYTFNTTREVVAGTLTGSMPAYWAVGSLAPLNFLAPPPDSGAWFDEDGDGRPDRLKIWLHLAWTNSTQILAAWPNWSTPFMPSPQNISILGDGMIVDILVPEGLDGGTVATTTDLGRWSRDGDPLKAFPIFDRVAPIPMRAIIHRGTVWDTLRVMPSEAVMDVATGDDVLRKIGVGSLLPSYDFGPQWRDPVTGEFVFLFSATQTLNVPVPGDWVRFAPGGKARDVLGNVPGLKAKSVQIFGTDRPPADAVMLDSDGDGRADRVVLKLTQPLVSLESWVFRWSDTTGGLDVRHAATIQAKVDSFGLKLTFDLPPFAKGMTYCPASGCANLGSIVGTYEGVTLSTPFTIRDGVPPIAISGKMTFSGDDAIPDTLVVRFSEPVNSFGLSTQWVSIGDTIPGNLGKVVSPWSARLDSNGMKAIFLVDTNVAPEDGHGIRITPKGIGGISDRLGNHPTDTAAWGPLELGPIPPRLMAKPYPAMGRWDGLPPDPNEPTLQVLVRRGIGAVSAEWKTLDGKPFGLADTAGRSAFVGAKLELNGLTEGAAYVYDNMGVFVAYTDLKPVIDAMAKGTIETDTRDRYEVWVAWNGVYNNKIAPSGVYLMRILGYRKIDNRMYIQQKVVRMGWMIFQGR